jgi:hypothetical protein
LAGSHGPHVTDLAQQIKHGAGYRRTVSDASATYNRQVAAAAAKDVKVSTASASVVGAATGLPLPGATTSSIGIAAGGDLTSLSQSALNQYFSQIKDLGAKWVRWDIEWGTIQADGQNTFDWSGPDRVAAAAKANGINSLIVLVGTPKWSQGSGCNYDSRCPPADPASFGKFAGQAAARYVAQGIHYWEIWNEPNYSSSWLPSPSASVYASALKAAYASIHASDNQSAVLTGGLSAAADSDGNIAPITFIQGLYNSGAKGSFDAVALHPYSYPVLASYSAAWNFWQQMSTIRQVMLGNSDGKKIWVTEFGAPTGGPGTAHTTEQLSYNYPDDYMSEAAQALIASDVVAQYGQSSSWMGPFFWYSLKDKGTSSVSSENFFGLLRGDNSRKPAYDIIHAAAQ